MHIYAREEAMNRDGKAFDEVSDAVDEGQSPLPASSPSLKYQYLIMFL